MLVDVAGRTAIDVLSCPLSVNALPLVVRLGTGPGIGTEGSAPDEVNGTVFGALVSFFFIVQ